ncbi:MAG: peptidoglycan DD-metalloendopeptidase family protein [Desulfitobacteriaceae bacterium]|nr:peptidoglycan DD-metalloendopeptidase family protein [Desulfitobacteriaceae bacterium]MDD4345634.1 peptidoglycan DD-metalloendopeptidase family protein [Desulfitobacteriaceae bacterium]MDD4400451.1 peptidoglycan DD-metalloendopeptidase family protein [Desulfitobacteriaceae bacterium]
MFKKKFFRFGIVCFLSVAFLGVTVIPLRAGSLEDIVRRQNAITAKQKEGQGKLNNLTYTADKINAQLKELQVQINIANKVLNEKQAEYSRAEAQIKTVQMEIDKKQKELDARREVLGLRIKGIYEDGEMSYLGLLFQSTDLGDFISRMEYLGTLIANDQKLLDDIKKQQEEMVEKREELERIRDRSAQLLAEAKAAEAELEAKKRQHNIILEQNKKSQQAIIDENEKLEAESNALREKIRQLQAGRKGGTVGTVSNWPLPGYYEISSPYGWRTHPITGRRTMHSGIDVAAPTGAALRAVGAGDVILAGWYGGYGNAIVIDHGGGTSTLYGHLSRLAVSDGQKVSKGQVIGYVGSTGFSTGPHLHFEVRINGNTSDPMRYFR